MMTIRDLFEKTLQRHGGRVALQYRSASEIVSLSYNALEQRVRLVAEFAERLELTPGQSVAAILLENGVPWVEIYLGLALCGITVLPLDPKLRAHELKFLLQDAGASAIFTDDRHYALLSADKLLPPSLRHFVVVNGGEEVAQPKAVTQYHNYAEALAKQVAKAAAPENRYDKLRPTPETIASLIYTSGTTGNPKGAMLTHANFCADAAGALQVIREINATDRFLVVLPLFHSFSFLANFIVPLSVGASMQFVISLRTLADDMRLFSPTILMAVPLLLEKMQRRIEEGLERSKVAALLRAIGLRVLVAKAIRRNLGGSLRLIVSGGAPCPREVLQGLQRLHLPLIEGYGLTEASPVVSFARPEEQRIGSVGRALPNVSVRIADADARGVGELQVRGAIVMRGYYNNPSATAEAFDGEWLRTGDLASLDADGFITICGRKKALIVNREGKNIYPEEVEICIARDPRIYDIVVIGYHEEGNGGERVGAIAVPNLAEFAVGAGEAPPWPEVEEQVRRIIKEQCADLADYKHPRKVEVRREALERTSLQKVRRHLYQGELD